MNLSTILFILAAHYVGDWVAQPFMQRWMGQKHRSMRHLLTHVAVLAIPLMLLSPLWGIVNAIAHGLVDFITSRLTHKFYSQGTVELTDVDGRKFTAPIPSKNLSLFWLTIGTDQTIHLATLYATWSLLT